MSTYSEYELINDIGRHSKIDWIHRNQAGITLQYNTMISYLRNHRAGYIMILMTLDEFAEDCWRYSNKVRLY